MVDLKTLCYVCSIQYAVCYISIVNCRSWTFPSFFNRFGVFPYLRDRVYWPLASALEPIFGPSGGVVDNCCCGGPNDCSDDTNR